MELFEEATLIEIPSRYDKGEERSAYRNLIEHFLKQDFGIGKIVCEYVAEAQVKAASLRRWTKQDDHVKVTSRRNIVYLVKEK